MKIPVSVVIATYNSERFLRRLIENLEIQKNVELEILIIDGCSSDQTQEIARNHQCNVIINSNRNPVMSKWLGFVASKNSLVTFIDHDELLLSEDSLFRKATLLNQDPQLAVVYATGYETKSDQSLANKYVSMYGDPISRYLNSSVNSEERLEILSQHISLIDNGDHLVTSGRYLNTNSVLIESSSQGVMIKKDFLKEYLPHLSGENLPLIFYHLILEGGSSFAFLKNDLIFHRSVDNWSQIRHKIRWRVRSQFVENSDSFKSGIRERYDLESKIQRNQGLRYRLPLSCKLSLFLMLTLFSFGLLGHKNVKLSDLKTGQWIHSSKLDFFVSIEILGAIIKKLIRIPLKKVHYSR